MHQGFLRSIGTAGSALMLSGCGPAAFDVALEPTPTPPPFVQAFTAQARVGAASLRWTPPVEGESLQLVIRETAPVFSPDLHHKQLVIDVAGTTSRDVEGLAEDREYTMQLTDAYFQPASAPLTIRTFPSGALEPIPFRVLRDNIPGAGFGASAILAGDLDADGIDDIAVGAPNFSNGQAYEGAVFIYSGALLFTNATPIKIEGDQDLAMMGRYLAPAGRFDADGIDDLLVAAPFPFVVNDSALTPAGMVLVIEGDPVLPAIGSTFAGIENDLFGSALLARDFDGGGEFDLLIGGPGEQHVEMLSTDVSFSAVTTSNSLLGYSVAAGDFDGDGDLDIALGEPLWGFPDDPGEPAGEMEQGGPLGDPWHSGRVQVYLADAPGVFQAAPTTLLVGTTAGQMMGSALHAADLDGDLDDDLLVGATHCAFPSPAPWITPGAIHVWLGDPAGFAATAEAVLSANSLCLGRSIASGDVNGDGSIDIVAGDSAGGDDGNGEVRVFLGDGVTALPAAESSSIFGGPGSSLGIAVGVGNLAGDLRAEVLAGAPGSGEGMGAVNLYRGASRFGVRLTVSELLVTGQQVTPVVSFESQEGPPADYRCLFLWGDGSAAEEFPCSPGLIPTASHTYAPGEWVLRVRVMSLTDRYGESAIRVSMPASE